MGHAAINLGIFTPLPVASPPFFFGRGRQSIITQDQLALQWQKKRSRSRHSAFFAKFSEPRSYFNHTFSCWGSPGACKTITTSDAVLRSSLSYFDRPWMRGGVYLRKSLHWYTNSMFTDTFKGGNKCFISVQLGQPGSKQLQKPVDHEQIQFIKKPGKLHQPPSTGKKYRNKTRRNNSINIWIWPAMAQNHQILNFHQIHQIC